jgi:hypothetical protein
MARILALYLPQFHTFPENDQWWGKGYTEWTAVKNAKPLYKGHHEPRIPLNNNYYDLSDESGKVWNWQSKLAKEYGIYGFCIYDYWFCGKQLMEKPLHILQAHPEIDLKYCICWANESWTRTWYGLKNDILMEQTYGDEEDWVKHYNHLREAFLDPRYIKKNNSPVLCIYHTHDIERLEEMRTVWKECAQKDGFDDIYIVSGNTNAYVLESRDNLVDAYYNFEPGYSLKHKQNQLENCKYLIHTFTCQQVNKLMHKNIVERVINTECAYKQALKRVETTKKKVYLGLFPQWDNTPRRSYRGLVYKNSSPALFKKYLEKAISITDADDFIFLNAWNEWGEGAYLEPDTVNGYKYLEAIKELVQY